ncbi:DEAD/DEAH box helicase [Vibrio sp. SM6]|uniref:ATP-dependent RNA helicase RhlE n=1 Tax=Vibrio agarilyticus TaxID=2726741 RepID=A0A7X8YFY2_9VIBR|nr:DEAD/DEAH box helicase [Vibrio agarilyticus]NLS11831.1 DEAD/DEAH box helicase [Vibrio agarilyticus]
MSFASLGLSLPIVKAVESKGYLTPSPIQEQAIPAVLAGHDLMAAAQTGTGKTAGFTLPILERLTNGPKVKSNHIRALVLTPTRELAAQVQENVFTYSINLPLTSAVVFGGVKINPQMMRLRKGADVLVATPGRLLDLYQQNALKFSQLEVLVLDEADRMLDMGFIRDIEKILALLPKRRQTLLFSATFSDEIRTLATGLLNQPVEISVSAPNSTARTVEQAVYPADVKKKPMMLAKMIEQGNWQQTLVFTRTKHGANKLAAFLNEQGISSAAIHGNKSQGARTKALADFKSNEIRVLVATDIAARGIDIPQLPQVVNFELPKVAEDYVHRIGRTGRAGETGHAISLVCALEAPELFAIERLTQQVLPRLSLDGFVVSNSVPESKLDTRPIKPKKPKKPKKPREGNAQNETANERGESSVKQGNAGAAKRSGHSHAGKRHRGNAKGGKAQRGKAQRGKAQEGKPNSGNRSGDEAVQGNSKKPQSHSNKAKNPSRKPSNSSPQPNQRQSSGRKSDQSQTQRAPSNRSGRKPSRRSEA